MKSGEWTKIIKWGKGFRWGPRFRHKLSKYLNNAEEEVANFLQSAYSSNSNVTLGRVVGDN